MVNVQINVLLMVELLMSSFLFLEDVVVVVAFSTSGLILCVVKVSSSTDATDTRGSSSALSVLSGVEFCVLAVKPSAGTAIMSHIVSIEWVQTLGTSPWDNFF